MINILKNFFENNEANNVSAYNELELICGLLIEAANTDGNIDDEEISKIEDTLTNLFEENNDEVKFQQPIISFEKTQLQNSYDLALQELAVIETELLQAQQSSFQSKQDKALLAQLQRKIQIAQEKVNYQQLLLEKSNILYDLVYNPSETLFIKKGKEIGCKTLNGYEMLKFQAEMSWNLWTKSTE